VSLSISILRENSYSSTRPEAINSVLRIIAVSATLPNISEIAAFLEANEAYTFDESYRPVPLTTHVIGQGKIGEKSTGHFHFWRNLDRNVPEIIRRFSKARPAIVFCHSKADTEKLADLLATAHNIGKRDDGNSGIACRTRISKLQRVLLHGIAYHHAGLEMDDRRLVEKSFSDRRIRVLCAQSTLAMGVNLPVHLVIIKGTKAWRGGGNGYQDLDQASLLQMIGRAGRPGFDTSGTAVIMTDNDSKIIFEKLASSGLLRSAVSVLPRNPGVLASFQILIHVFFVSLTISAVMSGISAFKYGPRSSFPQLSQLVNKLVETINTEISQRVITNTEHAINWLTTTLYYIQLARDPAP
jgi:replicative superfamily II helicase